MLWDRAIIMQGGVMRVDKDREELDTSLEELFFAVTEGEEEQEGAAKGGEE